MILWCLKAFKTTPIGIGILRIVKSSQESIFDIQLLKWVFMKNIIKKETKEISIK